MADETVIGLCLAKINGIYELDMKGFRYSVRRPLPFFATGAGQKHARGQASVSASIDEVIPRQGATNWANQSNFSIELYDYETQKILLFSAQACDWEGIDGSVNMDSATTNKAISMKGNTATTF